MANEENALSLFKKSKRRKVDRKHQLVDDDIGRDELASTTPILKNDESDDDDCKNPPSKTSTRRAAADMTASSTEKRRKEKNEIGAPVTAANQLHQRAIDDATRTSKHDKPKTSAKDTADVEEKGTGLYKGQKGYTNRTRAIGGRKMGPFKAPSNVRSTSVFDYQPNLCKDYKETGYCGYGDSCVFLHDRSNSKTGWQLEKEFEEAQQGVQRDNPKLWKVGDEDDDTASSKKDEEELPFACLLCRRPFTKPVVTKCQHYFCEACALAQYRKTPKCFACGAATSGVFKPAKRL